MPRLVRVFVVAFVSLAIVGCWATNARDLDAAVIPRDARRTTSDAFGVDGPPIAFPDAGTDVFVAPDAACASSDERNVRFCVLTPTGTIPEREPYTLRVVRGQCRCEPRVCDVQIGGGVIDLGITTCDSGLPCDECTDEAECVLPPLEGGSYRVRVDGTEAGSVTVAPRRMVMDAQPACWAIPEPTDASLLCDGGVIEGPREGSVCFRALEDVGSFARFSLTLDCADCNDWSAGCAAVRESARSILLRPRLQRCDCPGCMECGDGCTARTITCETPPLRDGAYEVHVERLSGERQRIGTLEVMDVDIPAPVTCQPLP